MLLSIAVRMYMTKLYYTLYSLTVLYTRVLWVCNVHATLHENYCTILLYLHPGNTVNCVSSIERSKSWSAPVSSFSCLLIYKYTLLHHAHQGTNSNKKYGHWKAIFFKWKVGFCFDKSTFRLDKPTFQLKRYLFSVHTFLKDSTSGL
jgi:hypothetical protein